MSKRLYSGRYEVQEFIAEGEMGAVYKAWDNTSFDQVVALKVVHSQLSSDADFIERFRDEARKTARLQEHPNIVKIFDVANDHGTEYLIMEYFPSTNLRDHLRSLGKFPLGAAITVTRQIAQALSHTHACDLIHRDIKPANILIDSIQQVKLTDFGIAKALSDAPLTPTGQVIGTLKYMSPEQARNTIMDGRSDLYSLGMVLYELVTGKNLWKDIPNLAIYSNLQAERTIPAPHFPSDVPQEIQGVISDLLKFDPADRIQNAESLIIRLENLGPISSTIPPQKPVEDSDETVIIPRIAETERLKDDKTEKILHAPTIPQSSQKPTVSEKKVGTQQTTPPPGTTKETFPYDPASKARDPAKPYYWADDSHSFKKHRKEAEAHQPLFSNQIGSPMKKKPHSFSKSKLVAGFAMLILVGVGLYWNQEFFAKPQPTTAGNPIQEPPIIKVTKEKELAPSTTQMTEQAQIVKATSLSQKTEPATDAQTVAPAKQEETTPTPQAAEPEIEPATEAQIVAPAKKTETTLTPQAAEPDQKADPAAVAQAVASAKRAKTTPAPQEAEPDQKIEPVAEAQSVTSENRTESTPTPPDQNTEPTAEAQIVAPAKKTETTPTSQVAALAQKAKAAAQAAGRDQKTKTAIAAQAAEPVQKPEPAAEAQTVAPAKRTETTPNSQVAALTPKAKGTAAQAAERAKKAKAAAAARQAAKRAKSSEASVDSQAAALAQKAKAAAALAAERAKKEEAATAVQSAALNQKKGTASDTLKAKTVDTQALMNLLEELRGYVAKRDLLALERLSTMSKSRQRMLKDLFARYLTVEVSIGDVVRELNKATATLQITKLIRPNGSIVRPHPIVQKIKVIVLKNDEKWNLPIW